MVSGWYQAKTAASQALMLISQLFRRLIVINVFVFLEYVVADADDAGRMVVVRHVCGTHTVDDCT